MAHDARKYLEKDIENEKLLTFRTDFELITYETEEIDRSCCHLIDEDIVFIRFIYAPYFKREFNMSNNKIHKYFFLPSHKASELKNTISKSEKTGDIIKKNFSKELQEYYTEDMLANLKPTDYYFDQEQDKKIVPPDERKFCSTSLFVLFNKKRFEEDGDISYDGILKAKDLDGLNGEQYKLFLRESGLDVCEQIRLNNYLVAVGKIKLNSGLLEWDQKCRTSKPEPGSGHVDFFKTHIDLESISYEDVANQFAIVDLETAKKRKRKNSTRR